MRFSLKFFRFVIVAMITFGFCSLCVGQQASDLDAFHVLGPPLNGPQITPFLQYQLDQAWRQDEERLKAWESIRTEADLLQLQKSLREKLLDAIGGLPTEKTDLRAKITGKIQMDGFTIEKLIYQSLSGIYVTALVYAPDDHSKKHPAVLVPAGHATNGKIHYQALSQRLASRGYVVIAWDPVGQGERSQFWDAKAGKSRYNLVCAEHAVMGNLAYLAGANLARWEVWDGMRAVDYLLTRPDVDPERISITGTSGGGTQTTLIAALDPRIKVAAPSCYVSSLPMRMGNRIFVDPDSDPEQDLVGAVSAEVDHPGLLLLLYPRPVIVASAVLDFFPIEGARRSYREAQRIYERFHHADRIAMTEGYHTHQYSVENQEAAIDFLDRFNSMPLRTGFAKTVDLPDAQLLCTKSGQVMMDESDARSLLDDIQKYYEANKTKRGLDLGMEYARSRPSNPGSWAVQEFKGAPAMDDQLLWEFRGSSSFGGYSVDRYLLRHSRFLQMPLLHFHGAGSAKRDVIFWLGENGKATSADWPEIEKLLKNGTDVVSFDVRGLGETRMAYTAVSPDDPSLGKLDHDHAYRNAISGVLANHVYNALLTGRPYFFQMIDDVAIARRFTASKLGAKVSAISASGDAFYLASGTAKIFPELKLAQESVVTHPTWVELLEKKQEVWPIEYLVPSGAYIH